MKKLFKNKKHRYRNLLLILLPLLIIASVLAFLSYKFAKDSFNMDGNANIKPSNVIEGREYVLRDNATEYQKELFKELKDDFSNSETTDLKIAEDIVKNYIADCYTWTNKQGPYDVGGMYYVSGYYKANNWTQAINGFYKNLSIYINEYGSEDLLEVDSIEIIDSSERDDKYAVGDELYEYYIINASWTYKPTQRFNTSKYATRLYFKVVKDDFGNFTIVEAFD